MKGKTWLIIGVLALSICCEKEPDIEIPDPSETEGDQRDRFIGNWTVSESSKILGDRNFIVNMSKDDQYPAQVNISNFYLIGTGDSVAANVSAVLVSTITVPDQTVSGSLYSGKGEMENDQKINFTYYIDDGNADKDTVSAVFIR
ncbi:MAG: hypothetical protein ACJAZ2_000315 [Glaciecola sp.]|jgi:hypothetical protein